MSDITKSRVVYVSTSKNADYVSAVQDEDAVSFTRTDLSQASVAAALEAASHQAEDERKSRDKGYDTTDYAGVKLAAVIRDRIRALITPDQRTALQAAIDAAKAEARAEDAAALAESRAYALALEEELRTRTAIAQIGAKP